MARNLNKRRILYSRLLAVVAVSLLIFTSPFLDGSLWISSLFITIGLLMVSFCVIGRIYATIFLGGHKNESLIADGPFSVCRNPLYLFSLIGVTGICFLSLRISFIIVIPYVMYRVYKNLIMREEAFLAEKFGEEYASYCARTPRFFPKLSLYMAPESITVYPEYLRRALRDGLWWFSAYPAIGLVYFLQAHGVLSPLFLLP